MHQSIPAAPIPPPGNCGAFAHLVRGDVAALARSHMSGSLPFEKTIEQTI